MFQRVIEAGKRHLKKLIVRNEGNESVETPTDETALFVLEYEDLTVGYLKLEEGVWHFEYAPDFKGQTEVKPLLGFTDVDKHYTSKELWPFFALRIPSLQQPSIQEIIMREHLDRNNEVALLRRFGGKTVANPFRLEPRPSPGGQVALSI